MRSKPNTKENNKCAVRDSGSGTPHASALAAALDRGALPRLEGLWLGLSLIHI